VAQLVLVVFAGWVGFDRQVLRRMTQGERAAIEWFGFGLVLFICVVCGGLTWGAWLLSRSHAIASGVAACSLAYACAVVRLLSASSVYRDTLLMCAMLLCPSPPSRVAAQRALQRYDALCAAQLQRLQSRDAHRTQRMLHSLLSGYRERAPEMRLKIETETQS